jgi:hypothetical protein
MSDGSWHDDDAKAVRVLQFVVCAMFAGVLLLLVVVLCIRPQDKVAAPLQPVSLTLIVAILVGVGLIARLLAVWQITVRSRRRIANGTYQPFAAFWPSASGMHAGQCSDTQCLFSVFQSKTMVSAAMFDGWALLAVIAYLIEGGPVSLGLAVLLALSVAAHFPTRSRIIGWVERQLGALEQEKKDNTN